MIEKERSVMTLSEGEFVFVFGDDWSGLYKDGKLVLQGHDNLPYDYRRALGVTSVSADLDWLEQEGRLPASLEDVVVAK